MDGTTMVLLIVVVAVLAGSFDNWVKHKAKSETNKEQDIEIRALKADVDRLTERVRVLERLATDEDFQLRKEFQNMA